MPKDLFAWTIDKIRKDASMQWIEELKGEWTTLCAHAITELLEGTTFLIYTDSEREWFADYIVTKINARNNNRPYVPFYKLTGTLPSIKTLHSNDQLDDIEDLLSVSFEKYTFWYIGKNDDNLLRISKRKDNAFLWIFDADIQNSFNLRSYDKKLDHKLLNLFELFNMTISAAMFGEVEI